MSDFLDPAFARVLDGLTDGQLVALVGYGEARSEPIEGLVAVLNVIRNRVDAKRFGDGWRGVCLRPWQFSCLSPQGGQRNYERVVAMAARFAAKDPVSTFDQPTKQCLAATHAVIEGLFADNVKKATHYHVAGMVPRPEWARDRVPVIQKAGHVFYANIP